MGSFFYHVSSGITKIGTVHRQEWDGFEDTCLRVDGLPAEDYSYVATPVESKRCENTATIQCRLQKRHGKIPQLQRRKQKLPEMFSIPTFPFSQRVRQRQGAQFHRSEEFADRSATSRETQRFVCWKCSSWDRGWFASDSRSAKSCIRREFTSLYYISGFRLRSTAIAS